MEHGDLSLPRINSFQLLVLSDLGEDRKLDYDTRASLGRHGPFAKFTRLAVIAFSGNHDNIRVTCEVQRRQLLKHGPFKGHEVAMLEVELGTIEAYEPRTHSRIECQAKAAVYRDSDASPLAAKVVDVSEYFLRLVLESADAEWPYMSEKKAVSTHGEASSRKTPH